MSVWAFAFDVMLAHSEAVAVVGLGLYIAYEVRIGAIHEVRQNQRVLGVGLYRVIERDKDLDEEAFADALWGDTHEDLLYQKLTEGG